MPRHTMFPRWSRNIWELRENCVVSRLPGHYSDARRLTRDDATRRPQLRGLVNQPFPTHVDEEAVKTEEIRPNDRRHDVRNNETLHKLPSKAEV